MRVNHSGRRWWRTHLQERVSPRRVSLEVLYDVPHTKTKLFDVGHVAASHRSSSSCSFPLGRQHYLSSAASDTQPSHEYRWWRNNFEMRNPTERIIWSRVDTFNRWLLSVSNGRWWISRAHDIHPGFPPRFSKETPLSGPQHNNPFWFLLLPPHWIIQLLHHCSRLNETAHFVFTTKLTLIRSTARHFSHSYGETNHVKHSGIKFKEKI